jgi:Uncharacterized conserved protein
MTAFYFDNRFIHELPGDPSLQNQPRQVLGAFWSPVVPQPVETPQLIAFASEVAALLGIPEAELTAGAWLNALSGNAVLPGMTPFATCYGGHQFGQWAGQLGDGRAISLGELIYNQQRWELQLKGAGVTPYSRRGDGKAVLRSSIREFLCSEAMYHLGVPTTRALSLVLTGESIWRDMFYDGNPKQEPGAIVCRVAPSFIRFGHFQLPAMRGEHQLLNQLIDFTIDRDFPHLSGEPATQRRARWFHEICRATATLMVEWMRVGFVHGVMNTDNMSILGLTLDYGPYGWVDNFDLHWTPNTTDAEGRRYCFGRQPAIARWNLQRLAEALGTVMSDHAVLEEGLSQFDQAFAREIGEMLAAKLGFTHWQENDSALVDRLFALLQQAEVDMTLFFRQLAVVEPHTPDLTVLADVFYRDDLFQQYQVDFQSWLQDYGQRVLADGQPAQERLAKMNRVNPLYVLRNYLAQQVIEDAEQGNYQPIAELLEVLRHPYTEQSGKEAYAQKRPDWAREKAGCSMLSCSS